MSQALSSHRQHRRLHVSVPLHSLLEIVVLAPLAAVLALWVTRRIRDRVELRGPARDTWFVALIAAAAIGPLPCPS